MRKGTIAYLVFTWGVREGGFGFPLGAGMGWAASDAEVTRGRKKRRELDQS